MRNDVIIIENKEDNINIIENLIYEELGRKSTSVHLGVTVEKILYIVKNNYIDLIILNLDSTLKDIFKILDKINYLINKREFNIPIIVYSNSFNKDTVEKLFELGAIDYFIDPLSSDEKLSVLSFKIKNALKNYKYNKYQLKINAENKKQLRLGTILQKSLMFKYKELQNIKISGRYIPSTGLGGDCYDSIETNGKTWFMIADVMGHGASAAMVSFMVKALFNQLATMYKTPKKLLEEINTTYYKMFENKSDIIFSIFIGTIYKNKLTYSSAGHPYPIFYDHETKNTQFLSNNNILIGITPNSNFSQKTRIINEGDIIFLYTDGLYEQIPDMRDINLINMYIKTNKDILIKNQELFMDNIIKQFNDTEQFEDDVAILTVKKK
ncbi:fused response regulator/phosphatase [Senegalia massiliensis]|uniref:Stage 0 sporulation protein A homolog n=1 Tax=Senegalia massiliensis TaxID=1720316 RepID=A0A845QTD5_9CLOT|nr:fused response regulator/phosphatase [Senegalia massiliensis]NBI05471.1 hypothetical protein [Senegalia massiliensis]